MIEESKSFHPILKIFRRITRIFSLCDSQTGGKVFCTLFAGTVFVCLFVFLCWGFFFCAAVLPISSFRPGAVHRSKQEILEAVSPLP